MSQFAREHPDFDGDALDYYADAHDARDKTRPVTERDRSNRAANLRKMADETDNTKTKVVLLQAANRVELDSPDRRRRAEAQEGLPWEQIPYETQMFYLLGEPEE